MGKLTNKFNLLELLFRVLGVTVADSPKTPQDDDSAAKKFIAGLSFPGVKTFTAAGTGTRYVVIAERNGISLSLTPKIETTHFVSMMIRARAQRMVGWANISEAPSLFGLPFTERSPDHSSIEIFMIVAKRPATAFQVGKIISDNKLIDLMVSDTCSKVEKAGAKLLATPFTIIEYMRNLYESSLPSQEPAVKPVEFKIITGVTAWTKAEKALLKLPPSDKTDDKTPKPPRAAA